MNETKRGMFSGSPKGGMKKTGLKIAKAVGHFLVTTQDGLKAINSKK